MLNWRLGGFQTVVDAVLGARMSIFYRLAEKVSCGGPYGLIFDLE